ncbi:Ribose transport system permease protein RbsC [Phycisphaerae bacterium RAS2]|nr:Ribose transport system permease protein RbsC [Phycisphaerae bacterium RAS2]
MKYLSWDLMVRGRMVVVLLLLIAAAASLTDGVFLQPDNLVNVARQISLEAMIAFGMTLIIITGGIDLSVGSVVALAGVVAAIAMRAAGGESAGTIVVGALAACGTGLAGGAASGAIITRFALPPFIVTLALMLVARGLAFIFCGGEPIYEGLPQSLLWLGRGFVFENVLGRRLPVPVMLMAMVFAASWLLLARTVMGRCVIAIGCNEEAARLAGIPVRRTKLFVYVLTGGLAGLVGLLHDGKLMAADPKIGEMWELNIIAAVVVGGTSLFGGRGGIPGTLVGALIIGVLNNMLNLMGVQHFWQKIVLGLVILAAALLDAAMARLGRR